MIAVRYIYCLNGSCRFAGYCRLFRLALCIEAARRDHDRRESPTHFQDQKRHDQGFFAQGHGA